MKCSLFLATLLALCSSLILNIVIPLPFIIFWPVFFYPFTLSWSAAATAKSLQSCPTVRPHRRQPTRLRSPWDSPGKNTGVGCHFLLHCMKVRSESEVAQSCPTPSDPVDCSLPGSSIHGIFQARVLEWGAIAFWSIFSYLKSVTASPSVRMALAYMLGSPLEALHLSFLGAFKAITSCLAFNSWWHCAVLVWP